MNAIKCYSSQFYDPSSKEPETLISKKNFLDMIYNRSSDLGRLIGVEHAEGFTSNRVRHFLNNLCSESPTVYLELGCYTGSTFYAATHKNGIIAAIGDFSGKANEVIDANNLVVTPGFVDIHTHYDGQAIWDSQLKPSSIHGVTTVVMGNCGAVSYTHLTLPTSDLV